MATFRPIHDRVLIREAAAATTTSDGIILPDIAQERPMRGEVIAVGEGRQDTNGLFTAMTVNRGDTVMYGKFSGVKIVVDEEELLLMRESDIFGIVEDDND